MDPKDRFSDRVADYVRYRPGYPSGLILYLAELTGLTPDWVVADLGSGTGLSSRPFLEHGNLVYGVEPNDEMRAAAEALFADHARFVNVEGSAESTGLEAASVDVAIAGQAFHWFDVAAARAECLRIVRQPCWVALFWNVRLTEADAFARGYEELLERYGTDYERYRARRIRPEALRDFFGTPPEARSMPNEQTFDFDGLRGRHLSSSYVPNAGHPEHEPMMRALRRLFDDHAVDGRVRFEYETQLFVERLA